MNMKPIKWNKINFNNISVGLDNKDYKLYYKYNPETDNEKISPLLIQFPIMYMPYDLNDSSFNKSYYFDMFFYNKNEKGENEYYKESEFYSFINNLEEKIKELINNNNNLNKGKVCSEFNIAKENKTKCKFLRLNLSKNENDEYSFTLFQKNKEKIEKVNLYLNDVNNYLKKNTYFIPSLSFNKIYFYKNNFNMNIQFNQILILEIQKENICNLPKGYLFG